MKRSDLFAMVDNQYTGYTVYDYAGEKIGNVDASLLTVTMSPSTWGCRRPRLHGGIPSSPWT